MATVSQAELLKRTLAVMEPDLAIPKKNAKDFIESLQATVEEIVSDGEAVNLFGLVKITPKGIPAKPKRKGIDRETGEETTLDPVPAKTGIRATVLKRVKEALPTADTSVGRRLVKEAKERRAAALARAEERERAAEKGRKPKPSKKKK